jgi:hypothetical protein
MRARQCGATMFVVRSEDESGRVGHRHMLDAERSGTLAPPLAREPTTRVAAEPHAAGRPFVRPGAARDRAPGHQPDPLERAGSVPAAVRR